MNKNIEKGASTLTLHLSSLQSYVIYLKLCARQLLGHTHGHSSAQDYYSPWFHDAYILEKERNSKCKISQVSVKGKVIHGLMLYGYGRLSDKVILVPKQGNERGSLWIPGISVRGEEGTSARVLI